MYVSLSRTTCLVNEALATTWASGPINLALKILVFRANVISVR